MPETENEPEVVDDAWFPTATKAAVPGETPLTVPDMLYVVPDGVAWQEVVTVVLVAVVACVI